MQLKCLIMSTKNSFTYYDDRHKLGDRYKTSILKCQCMFFLLRTLFCFLHHQCFKSFLGLDKKQKLHTLFVRALVDPGCRLVGHVICLVFCVVFFCLWSVFCAQCWTSLDCLFLIVSSGFLYRLYLMSWRQILSKFKWTIFFINKYWNIPKW